MTLAYNGKSRKRGVGLALAAFLAVVLGTVFGAGALQGSTSAHAWSHTLDVVTTVNGGTKTAADFSIYVHNSSDANVSGSPHAGEASPGTGYGLEAGTYTVGVVDPMGYSVGYSGACASGGSVTIDTDTVHTCTITLTSNAQVLTGPLQLTSMCSENPDATRHWRVRNPNSVDVEYTWEVVGTDQTGSGTAPAGGDTFFDTTTVTGPNTTKIYWMDNGVEQSTVKASGGVACEPSTVGGNITINKHWQEANGEDAESNLPSAVDFTYTGADGGGSFQLTGDSWTWGLKSPPTGYYHFEEAAIPGWHTVDVHCYSSAAPAPRAALAEADASFTLNEGESWTCDFTNQRVEESSQTYTVTIAKYISGNHADATNANNTTFNMTWSGTLGSGTYTLDPAGYNGAAPYEAVTSKMAAGSTYATSETGVPTAPGDCQPGDAYYLAGYKTSTVSVADAAAKASFDPASPNFTSLSSDEYVVVVNLPCQQSNVGGTITINKLWHNASGNDTTENLPASVDFTYTDPDGKSHDFTLPDSKTGEWTWTLPAAPLGHYAFEETAVDGWHTTDIHCYATPAGTMGPQGVEADGSFTMKEGENWTCDFTNQPTSSSQTYTVTIAKYISGAHADATNANNTTFNMNWSGTLGGGSYTLGPDGFNGGPAYEAKTAAMAAGDSYATNETGLPMAPGECTAETPYYLAGYRVSSTDMADAANAQLTPDSPNFTNLQSNQYVIVVNQPCQAQNLVGSITIVKSWEDANGSQVADPGDTASFTGSGTGVDATFDLTSTSMSPVGPYSRQFFGLASGTYTFTESPIDGWTLTDITCAGQTASTPTYNVPGSMLSIAFDNTEGMTCTFHNQQNAAPTGATLTIVKEWRDAEGDVMDSGFGTANFTSDIPDNASFMLGTGNSGASNVNELVISGITPNTYHITEVGQEGWTFVSSSCGTSQNSLVPSSSFGVVVPENGNITCTVVNQAVATGTTGSITIMKQWQNADGSAATSFPTSANFTSSIAGSETFALGSAGWSTTFSDLAAGAYSFNEDTTGMTGWNLVSATCTDNANSASVAFNLNGAMYEASLAAGQNVTCTFVNRSTNTLLPSFPVVPIITTPNTPTASPSATESPSATTTTSPPTTVPTNTGNESPSTNTGNTGVNEQPSNLGNNAPSANNAVAGVQAPGAPSTGSGSAMSGTGNTLAIALGLVTIAASAAAFAFSRKNRS